MKKFTLRDILICAGAFLGVLVFIFSIVAELRIVGVGMYGDTSYLNFIWGATRVKDNVSGAVDTLPAEMQLGAVALPLIGAILALVAGLGAVVVNFLVKDEKVRRICMFVCGGLLVLGGVFTFFAETSYLTTAAKKGGMTLDQYKQYLQAHNLAVKCGLPIVSGILAIVGGGAVCASEFVK